MNEALPSVERAVLAGYLRIIDPPPGFVLPLFRDCTLPDGDRAPPYLVQEIDANQVVTGFTPFDPAGGDLITALEPCERRMGDPCIVAYELSTGHVLSGTHAELRARLSDRVNDAELRERPFARWEVADFCGLAEPMLEIARQVGCTAGRSRSLAFFHTSVLGKSFVRERFAAVEGGQSLPAGSFHVVERGGALAIEPGEGLSAEAHAVVSGALAEFEKKVIKPPAGGAKAVVHVGVDPRTLPDLAVFKDIDAPWCPEMVVIPAGEFLMGSPSGEAERSRNEGPQHRVTIGYRFALGRYAVTFDEYDHFCAVTGREKLKDRGWGRGRRPVINVIWRDAVAYCEWLSERTGQRYRLPSEAEWEYACRAGTTTPFSFGATIGAEQVNHDGNHPYGSGEKGVYRRKTIPVGSLPANPWGLHEMHGNVSEWVEDAWHASYEGAPADGSAWLEKSAGGYRVLRGGSWILNAQKARSASRNAIVPGFRINDRGFRCARVLEP